jgi:hypothetical protein
LASTQEQDAIAKRSQDLIYAPEPPSYAQIKGLVLNILGKMATTDWAKFGVSPVSGLEEAVRDKYREAEILLSGSASGCQTGRLGFQKVVIQDRGQIYLADFGGGVRKRWTECPIAVLTDALPLLNELVKDSRGASTDDKSRLVSFVGKAISEGIDLPTSAPSVPVVPVEMDIAEAWRVTGRDFGGKLEEPENLPGSGEDDVFFSGEEEKDKSTLYNDSDIGISEEDIEASEEDLDTDMEVDDPGLDFESIEDDKKLLDKAKNNKTEQIEWEMD